MKNILMNTVENGYIFSLTNWKLENNNNNNNIALGQKKKVFLILINIKSGPFFFFLMNHQFFKKNYHCYLFKWISFGIIFFKHIYWDWCWLHFIIKSKYHNQTSNFLFNNKKVLKLCVKIDGSRKSQNHNGRL